MRGIATIEDRRLQLVAGMQHVAEVERIEAAGHAHFVQLILLDGDAPRTAPREGAEPDFTVLLVPPMLLVRTGGLDGKPRIRLVPRGSAPALDHARAGV